MRLSRLLPMMSVLLLLSCGGSSSDDTRASKMLPEHMTIPMGGPPARPPQHATLPGVSSILLNAGFDNGVAPWQASAEVLATNADIARSGANFAWFGGYNNAYDTLYQDVAIPANATAATVQFWFQIATSDPAVAVGGDSLTISVLDPATGATLLDLARGTNADVTNGWTESKSFDLIAYKGRTVRIRFVGATDAAGRSDFVVDDVTVLVTTPVAQNQTLNMTGSSADYTITGASEAERRLSDKNGASQSLAGVTRIYFSDSAVDFNQDGVPAQIYRLYVTVLGRQPDIGGIGFWTQAVETIPMSMDKITNDFMVSKEFITRYGDPATMSNNAFVNLLYANVLSRTPDADGLNFYLDYLAKNPGARAQIVLGFSNSPENKANVLPSVSGGIKFVPPALNPTCSANQVLVENLCQPRPKLIGTTPASGAGNINTSNIYLLLNFDQLMAKDDLRPAKVTISPAVNGATEQWIDSGEQSVWRLMPPGAPSPATQLAPGTRYTVTVDSGIKSAAGAPLAERSSFSFTTSATCTMGVAQGNRCVAPVCAAPQVLTADWLCSTPSCPSGMVMQNGVCVTPPPPPPTCVLPQVLQNNVCVTPPPPVCVPPQVLQNNICVTPVVPVGLTVVATSPTDGATLLHGAPALGPVTKSISVTFGQDVNPATLNHTFWAGLINGASPSGTVTYAGRTATLTFPNGFPGGVYRATVNQGVLDVNGRKLASDYVWTFTVVPDIKVAPEPGMTNVERTAVVSADFTPAMNAATINGNSFILRDYTSKAVVAGNVSFDGKRATFRPAALAYDTSYSATLTTAIKDAAGNGLDADLVWVFRTGSAPPPTCKAPQVLQNGACVTPPSCVAPKVLQNGVCVTPTTTNPGGGGSTSPDADGCFIPPRPCLTVESSTKNKDNYVVVKYRNSCGARVYVTMCNQLISGKQDCGADGVSAGGLLSWWSYAATGNSTYVYTGSTKSSSDWVCKSKDPSTKNF
jgi:hypothetical protein